MEGALHERRLEKRKEERQREDERCKLGGGTVFVSRALSINLFIYDPQNVLESNQSV